MEISDVKIEPDDGNEAEDVTTKERLDHDFKKQYTCDVCSKQYSSPRALNRHLKLHENKTFICSSCTKTFQTRANLTRHFKTVHTGSVKQHLCSYCGEGYKSRESLIRHVRFIHKNCGKICSICSKICRDNEALQRHEKSHFNDLEQCKGCHGNFKDLRAHRMSCPITERTPIYCEFCGQQFLVKRYLAEHIKRKHTQSDKFLCHCGKIYPYRFSFKRHQLQCVKKETEPDDENEADDVTTEERLGHDIKKQYACDVCNKQYSSPRALNRHLKLHENKTFKCSSCTKTFQTRANLTRHFKTVHTGSVKQHLCSYCGEWYKSRESLIRHVRFIHKNCGKVCSICSKICRDNEALQRHEKSHFNDLEQCIGCHGNFKDLRAHRMSCPITERTPIYCEFCGQQFLVKRYLAEHIKRKHTQSDKYLCHCGKIYPYRFSFKRHQLQCVKMETEPDDENEAEDVTTEERLDHDVKKQYVCDVCNKQYSSPLALNRHLKLHENKTFKCSCCTKTFQTRANLTRHFKTVHTGSVKQHLCSYCGEWYKSRESLIRHVRFIHKNCGKICSICSKICRDNATLQRHEKSHFNDLEQCKGCHGNFKDLRAHRMSCPITERNTIYCEFCGKQFLAKRYLAGHIKCKHTQSDKYLCHCGKIYPYRFSFKRHQLHCVKREVI